MRQWHTKTRGWVGLTVFLDLFLSGKSFTQLSSATTCGPLSPHVSNRPSQEEPVRPRRPFPEGLRILLVLAGQNVDTLILHIKTVRIKKGIS